MRFQFTYPLNELNASHVSIAGGKGASLGELIRSGASVPQGFVITIHAFEAFMKTADTEGRVEAIVEKLDRGELTAGQAEEQLISHLDHASMPSQVAVEVREASTCFGGRHVSVRSSATCEDSAASAWAGQLDTYLDVSPSDIVEKVRDCWFSIFKESALAYGSHHGYGAGKIGVAVVIQEMIASEVSGIGFSVHPVTQEPDLMMIEACLGLGEAIVSGKIVPDQYVVERHTGSILDRSIGEQQTGLFVEPGQSKAHWQPLGDQGQKPKLTDQQILSYSKILSNIQDHYGHPVDTEWALQDGQFWLLQARPITTLAEEYQDSIIDKQEEWAFVVRRPMSLMEVSLWSHWLDPQYGGAETGFVNQRSLSIQDAQGMANDFISEKARDSMWDHIVNLLQNNRAQIREILQYGHDLYCDSEERIKRGSEDFQDLDEAADFMARVAQYTTSFPSFVLLASQQEGCQDPEAIALAETLRARTLYPAIERYIIDPLAVKATKALGFSEPEQAPKVATWSELREGSLDRNTLEWRLKAVRNGHYFVFQSLDGHDQVRFLSQTGYLLMRLANQRKIIPEEHADELAGQTAWPGIHRGRARVILSPDAVGQTIEEGEVLVSIQSSPALMPLLKRCGAIITDEGGVACHAAIIARELRKPTLIGTQKATSMIQTGDLVEVDTFAQVIRLLERANKS